MSDRPLTWREKELVDATNEYYDRLREIYKKHESGEFLGTEQEQLEQVLAEIEKLSVEVEEKYK